MNELSEDQRIRIQCLSLCGGSVSEAKQAYYWVMGEGQQKGIKPRTPNELKAQQELQEHVAMEQMHSGIRQNNAVNPAIQQYYTGKDS